ncbi:MAG: adenylate/guanylate cyclase domain-containing protein [Pseudomonadota bacterium]
MTAIQLKSVIAPAVATKVSDEVRLERAVMVADLEASTQWIHTMGDDRAWRHLRPWYLRVMNLIHAQGGHAYRHTGDGFHAAFETVAESVECAIAIQSLTHHWHRQLHFPRLRIGLAFGQCRRMRLHDAVDYFGGTIALAARLSEVASGGNVAMPMSLADDALRFNGTFDFHKRFALRRFPRPIDICVYQLEGERLGASLSDRPRSSVGQIPHVA